jgi:hypothetical protein
MKGIALKRTSERRHLGWKRLWNPIKLLTIPEPPAERPVLSKTGRRRALNELERRYCYRKQGGTMGYYISPLNIRGDFYLPRKGVTYDKNYT